MHRILTIKVLLVLVPWISSGLPYTGIEYDELYEVADEKGKSVMLYYHHDHCAACEWMEQNVFPEEKVQHFIEENFVAFELDGNT